MASREGVQGAVIQPIEARCSGAFQQVQESFEPVAVQSCGLRGLEEEGEVLAQVGRREVGVAASSRSSFLSKVGA